MCKIKNSFTCGLFRHFRGLRGIIPAVMTAFIVIACSSRSHLRSLDEADRLLSGYIYYDEEADTSVQTPVSRALDILDSLSALTLSGEEAAYADLLRIKAADKSYQLHRSDSLISRVLDYYTAHSSSPRYPEALYYGGRVYSDLGDYLTALQYFQQSLDAIPDDGEHLYLQACVLSQTADLYNDLRLFDQAIPYLEKSLENCQKLNDIFGMAYNYYSLALNRINTKDYERAEEYIRKAYLLANDLPAADRALMAINYADVKYRKSQIDSALIFLRPSMPMMDSLSKSSVLKIASEIYLKAGLLDTAYTYARELSQLTDAKNRVTGFRILLLPEMTQFSSTKQRIEDVNGYRDAIEWLFSQHESEELLLQNTRYNYAGHQRARQEAEKANMRLYGWLTGIVIVLLCSLLAAGYFRLRSARHLLDLHNALDRIDELTHELDCQKIPDSASPEFSHSVSRPTAEELRERLRSKLLSLAEKETDYAVPAAILESAAYKKLCRLVESEKVLPYNDELLEELEGVIRKCFPEFRKNFALLLGRAPTPSEMQLAVLIKCNVSPSKISTLLAVTQSAVSHSRTSLSNRCLGGKYSTTIFDRVIRLL